MNDDISNKLNRDTRSVGNVDIGATTINGLEAVHDQFLFQLNDHVSFEDNPERLVLDNSVAQSARFWVNRIIIAWVSDDIEAAITSANGIPAKTNSTISKALAVLLPVGVTPPAVINWIASSTREVAQFSPLSVVARAPAKSNIRLI